MNYNLLSFDDLLSEYKTLAGRANKRMERLEKAGMTTGSAYKAGARSASKIKASSGGTGSKFRFPTKRPADVKELRSRMNAVQDFLNDQTSTPAGVRKVGAKIGGTLKNKYGIDMSSEQIKATFDGALWSKLNNRFGSGTAVKIIAELQKSKGDVKAALTALQDQNVYLSGKEKMSIAATIGNYKRANKITYLFKDNE